MVRFSNAESVEPQPAPPCRRPEIRPFSGQIFLCLGWRGAVIFRVIDDLAALPGFLRVHPAWTCRSPEFRHMPQPGSDLLKAPDSHHQFTPPDARICHRFSGKIRKGIHLPGVHVHRFRRLQRGPVPRPLLRPPLHSNVRGIDLPAPMHIAQPDSLSLYHPALGPPQLAPPPLGAGHTRNGRPIVVTDYSPSFGLPQGFGWLNSPPPHELFQPAPHGFHGHDIPGLPKVNRFPCILFSQFAQFRVRRIQGDSDCRRPVDHPGKPQIGLPVSRPRL